MAQDESSLHLKKLELEIESLKQQNQDLDIALYTAVEHGDFIENQLNELNSDLLKEIDQRGKAESRLQKLVSIITEQKEDLELLVETIAEHGDWMNDQLTEMLDSAESCANIDGLTQIANRRHLDTFLNTEWDKSARLHTSFSVLFIDIDYFKQYNDSYGHLMGDQCLQSVAKALSCSSLNNSELAARYGGEEFVLILPDAVYTRAEKLAAEIKNAVTALKIPHTSSTVADIVTISIGFATCQPTHDSTADKFMQKIDDLLYKAKDAGRNRAAGRNYSTSLEG